jgi:hypothetical protein
MSLSNAPGDQADIDVFEAHKDLEFCKMLIFENEKEPDAVLQAADLNQVAWQKPILEAMNGLGMPPGTPGAPCCVLASCCVTPEVAALIAQDKYFVRPAAEQLGLPTFKKARGTGGMTKDSNRHRKKAEKLADGETKPGGQGANLVQQALAAGPGEELADDDDDVAALLAGFAAAAPVSPLKLACDQVDSLLRAASAGAEGMAAFPRALIALFKSEGAKLGKGTDDYQEFLDYCTDAQINYQNQGGELWSKVTAPKAGGRGSYGSKIGPQLQGRLDEIKEGAFKNGQLGAGQNEDGGEERRRKQDAKKEAAAKREQKRAAAENGEAPPKATPHKATQHRSATGHASRSGGNRAPAKRQAAAALSDDPYQVDDTNEGAAPSRRRGRPRKQRDEEIGSESETDAASESSKSDSEASESSGNEIASDEEEPPAENENGGFQPGAGEDASGLNFGEEGAWEGAGEAEGEEYQGGPKGRA